MAQQQDDDPGEKSRTPGDMDQTSRLTGQSIGSTYDYFWQVLYLEDLPKIFNYHNCENYDKGYSMVLKSLPLTVTRL